jgi:hypothetical protein
MRDGTPLGGRPSRHGPRHSPATHDVAISRATDREVVWILAPRQPEPEGRAQTEE